MSLRTHNQAFLYFLSKVKLIRLIPETNFFIFFLIFWPNSNNLKISRLFFAIVYTDKTTEKK